MEGMSSVIDEARIEIRSAIYHAGLSTLYNQLEDLQEDGTTMILGHNPGSEVLVNHLTGEWEVMPTANKVDVWAWTAALNSHYDYDVHATVASKVTVETYP